MSYRDLQRHWYMERQVPLERIDERRMTAQLLVLAPRIYAHFALTAEERISCWHAATTSPYSALRCYQAMANTIPLRSVHAR